MSYRLREIAPGVHLAAGDAVNWTLLTEGDEVTLVDAGYPGDLRDVRASLAEVGGTLRAILVTHAHIDHIGGIPGLLAEYDVPVLTSAREAAHARREFLEQAGPRDVARVASRPRTWPWIGHLLTKGALRDRPVPTAAALPEPPGPLDVPGRPVAVATPGHTSGHTAYLAGGCLLTGDALATGHPLSTVDGPQRIMAFFDHDPAGVETALDTIAGIEADWILPGHGPAWRGSPAEAVSRARRR
jgi:glyoxylase-like metal-dependent hydrolase (beta-lactamase superfamily II)